MELVQALLEFFELLFILLIGKLWGEVHIGQLRHLDEREFLLEGITDIPAFFKGLVNHVDQELQGIPYGSFLALAVKNVPGNGVVGILHKVVIGLEELFVFPVLPEIVRGDAPLGIETLFEGFQALKLLLLVDMQEDLQEKISPVPQLAFKLIDAADAALVFLF